MRKITLLSLVALSLLSCKDKASKTEDTTANEAIEAPAAQKTYAEISIKEGGSWDGKKYVGGDHFKNVDQLDVPNSHTDHSYYIRYEGPGWENGQVGYRLYIDWRTAIDIFGKKVDSMVLPYVGQDGFDSYHEPAPWGQDILKAGKSMGIGGYGRIVADTVVHFQNLESRSVKLDNTASSSSVNIAYKGWSSGDDTINLDTKLSIFPSDRFTKAELTPSKAIEGLCTGIVIAKDIPLLKKEGTSWAYIATYGEQSLATPPDNLGLALFYKLEDVATQKTGVNDHLVIFKPTTNTLTYYFLGAWEQEPNGLKTKEAFVADLDAKLDMLDKMNALTE